MATYYWVNGTGTWSGTGNTHFAVTSGGVATALNPVAADTVIFDVNSGTGVCTTAVGAICTTLTLNSSTLSLTLGANLTIAGTFSLSLGALNLNNQTLTALSFQNSNSNVRTIAFGTTGQIACSLSAGSGVNVDTATNFSYTGTSLINLINASGAITVVASSTGATALNAMNYQISGGTGGNVTFSNGRVVKNITCTSGYTGTVTFVANDIYGNLTLASTTTPASTSSNAVRFMATSGIQTLTSAGKTLNFSITKFGIGGTLQLQDALTMGSTYTFTLTNGTVQLKESATNTVGVFATSGTTQKYLQSTTAGTTATLSQASGTVNASYLTVQDITATGGATWNAFYTNGNVDNGNNLGWNFGGTPAVDTEIGYRLRSFTQPRRF